MNHPIEQMSQSNARPFTIPLLAASIACLLPTVALSQDGVRPSVSSLSRDRSWNGASFQPGQPGVSSPTYGPGVSTFRSRVSTLRPLVQERPVMRAPTDEQGRPIEQPLDASAALSTQAVDAIPGEASQFQSAPTGELPPEAADILKEDRERGLFSIGPMVFRASIGLRIEFNDNINLSNDDRDSDLLLTPQVALRGHWKISEMNDLTLNLGFGYTSYLFNSEYNQFNQSVELAPGTEIAFRLKVRDLYFRVFDRPAIEQDPTGDLTLNDAFNYSRFSNTAGLSVLWDLNKIQVQGGYQRYDSWSLTSEYEYLDQSTDTVYATVSGRVTDALTVGLETSFSDIRYKDDVQNDGKSYYVGVFADALVTPYLRVRVAGGYQGMTFDSGGLNGDNSDFSGPYGNVSLIHQVNQNLSHVFTVGHESALGSFSNYVETTYVREAVTWQFSSRMSLTGEAFYEHGEESGGPFAESIDRFGVGLSTSYQLTKKLRAELYYAYLRRNASGGTESASIDDDIVLIDRAGSYYQNRVGINLQYEF
jgi:hypothetical protein